MAIHGSLFQEYQENPSQDPFVPVSYTHLDVYKRQELADRDVGAFDLTDDRREPPSQGHSPGGDADYDQTGRPLVAFEDLVSDAP